MRAAASDTKTNHRRDSDDMKTIIAASSNAHKIKEIQAIMDKFGMKVVSRDDAGVPPFEIEEDGETFEENSYKKASEIMKVTGQITIADDSGLMVDYLGGRPRRIFGQVCRKRLR